MAVTDVSMIHHVGIVLVSIWLLSAYDCCHPVVYFLSLIYLYLVRFFHLFPLSLNLTFWISVWLVRLFLIAKSNNLFGVDSRKRNYMIFYWTAAYLVLEDISFLGVRYFLIESLAMKVHERYITRLRKKLQFEERKKANQRKVSCVLQDWNEFLTLMGT